MQTNKTQKSKKKKILILLLILLFIIGATIPLILFLLPKTKPSPTPDPVLPKFNNPTQATLEYVDHENNFHNFNILNDDNIDLEETYGYGLDLTLSVDMGLSFQPNQELSISNITNTLGTDSEHYFSVTNNHLIIATAIDSAQYEFDLTDTISYNGYQDKTITVHCNLNILKLDLSSGNISVDISDRNITYGYQTGNSWEISCQGVTLPPNLPQDFFDYSLSTGSNHFSIQDEYLILNNNLPVDDYNYVINLNNNNIVSPTPASGVIHVVNATIPNFTINDLSTTKKYSETGGQYDLGQLTTTIDNQGYTITYSVDTSTLPANLNGKVNINSTNNHLLIDKNAIPGNYTIKIIATASRNNYTTKIINTNVNYVVESGDFDNFQIECSQITSGTINLANYYSTSTYDFTNNSTISSYTSTWSLSNKSTWTYPTGADLDKISLLTSPSNRLQIENGLLAGAYTFDVQLQLSKQYYNNSTLKTFDITLIIGTMPTSGLKINGTTIVDYQNEYQASDIIYSTSTDFTLEFSQTIASADSFTYELTNNPNGIDISGNTISITNVNVGEYSFIVNANAKQNTTIICISQITFKVKILKKSISGSIYNIILNNGSAITRNYNDTTSQYTISLDSNFPSDFTGDTTYALNTPPSGITIVNNKLQIANTTDTSASSISLTSHSINDNNYDIADKTQTFQITINKINIPSGLVIKAGNLTSTTLTSNTYNQTSTTYYSLTVPNLPNGVTISSYNIDSSGTSSGIQSYVSITNSTELTITPGANAGSYSIKIIVNLNGGINYNNATVSTTFTLPIAKATLPSISIKAGNLTTNALTDLGFGATATYALSLNNAPTGASASSYSVSSTTASNISISSTNLVIGSGNSITTTSYNIVVQVNVSGGSNYNNGTFTTTFTLKIIKGASGTLNISVGNLTNDDWKLIYEDYSAEINLPLSTTNDPANPGTTNKSYGISTSGGSGIAGKVTLGTSGGGSGINAVIKTGVTTGTYTINIDVTATYQNYNNWTGSTTVTLYVAKENTKMTGNSAPSPFVASASSQYSGYEAYKAFDKGNSSTTYFCVSTENQTSAWLKLDVGTTAKKLVYTSIANANGGAGLYGVNSVILQGSNNNSTWDNYYTITMPNDSSPQQCTFQPDTATAFRYFRLNLTGNKNGWMAIGEWVLYLV